MPDGRKIIEGLEQAVRHSRGEDVGAVVRTVRVTRDGDMPAVVWSGSFRIFGVDVRCHVLSDGKRIIEADSMAELMEAMGSDAPVDEAELMAFARWQKGMSDAR